MVTSTRPPDLPPAGPHQDKAKRRGAAGGGGITVLVADALPLFSDSLAIALGLHEDMKVFDEQPSNGPATLEAAARLKPDVAVVDYWMPDMEGPALAGTIMRCTPETKVILLFWLWGSVDVQQAADSGAAGLLLKKGSVAQLAEAVREVWTKGSLFLSPNGDSIVPQEASEADEPLKKFQVLTARQIEVLALLNLGQSVTQIGNRLGISHKTVRNHISKMLTRVQARSTAETLAMARACGFFRGRTPIDKN